MKNIFFALTNIILMSSFSSTKTTAPKISLYNVKWQLVKIYTAEGKIITDTKTAFIKFNEAKKSAGGNAGCNTFGGTVLVKGDTIGITEIISTQMFCEDVRKTEQIFFNTLKKINRYAIKEKILYLYQNDKLLLEFAAK